MLKQASYKFLRYGLIFIVILMPFHALLTTWFGSNFGSLLWWRAWKEVLLLILTGIGLYYFITDKKLRVTIWRRLVNKLILFYALWHLFIVLVSNKDLDSTSQGLAINLRFLVTFVLMQVIVYYKPISRRTLAKIVILPSVGVVAFGKLQLMLLPKNFLTWFGYDKHKTIPPYFTIDEQQNKLRYASTLSGPNTLGAYLVLPLTMAIAKLKSFKKNNNKLALTLLYITASLIVLYSSHSRSAWLAAFISIGVFVFFQIPKRLRLPLVLVGVTTFIFAAGLAHRYRTTQFVEDIILHDNPIEGGEVSSNLGHSEALRAGLDNVAKHPAFGCGVGCAGPASVRSQAGSKIAENYYIQVAQETGLVGLVTFIAIVLLVGRELYKKRDDDLALVMFATLIGLSFSNLLLHTWADDSLAIIWWSAAAVVLYSKPDYN